MRKEIHLSEEHKQKIREKALGRHVSEETREKIRKANIGRKGFWKGKKLSEETKQKLSEAHLGEKNPNFGRPRTEETKEKIRMKLVGKSRSEETKKKISSINKGKQIGERNPAWKGGVTKLNIPLFDTYAHQIDWIETEEVRRDPGNEQILQVKCTYCGKWHMPTMVAVSRRLRSLYGKIRGENRFYCSEECKKLCAIYGQRKYRKDQKIGKKDNSREVQPELRKMVFERDGWICMICKSTTWLHCHHIEPINWNPLMSADIDNCMTVCKKCHKIIHKDPDCITRCKRKGFIV